MKIVEAKKTYRTIIVRTEKSMERIDLLNDIWSGDQMSLALRKDLSLWPEIQALATCQQDAEWHAEGDVLAHTDMVLAECKNIEASLRKKERGVLRTACLLHDIEKPKTTQFNEEINHIIAPKHERLGGISTRYILHEAEMSPENRRLISQLVATHHLVKRSVQNIDKPDGIPFLERLAERVDTKLLYSLEIADMRGRICKDQEGQIEIVELFKMLCEERDIFGKKPQPWLTLADIQDVPFVNSNVAIWCLKEIHRRRLLGTMKNIYQAKAFCWEHSKDLHEPTEVLITVGPSGSGKSSYIEKYRSDHIIISTDQVRKELYNDETLHGKAYGGAFQVCAEKLKEQLRKGWTIESNKVIYDATNVFYDLRKKIVDLCHDYNAYVKLIVFDVPKTELIYRNQQRERHVPDYVIENQCARFEWPSPEEAHDIIAVDNI